MEKIVIEVASQRIFRDLVEDIVTGKLASTIYHEAKKIYPLKRVEIVKTSVIKEKT
jgi:small subunit ribosomal protein S3Ae